MHCRSSSAHFRLTALAVLAGVLVLLAGCQPTPTPPPASFDYLVRVRDSAGATLPNVKVTVEVPGRTPLDEFTDVNGLVGYHYSCDLRESNWQIDRRGGGFRDLSPEHHAAGRPAARRDQTVAENHSVDSDTTATMFPGNTPTPTASPTATVSPTVTPTRPTTGIQPPDPSGVQLPGTIQR